MSDEGDEFEDYDWAADERWQLIECNLLIPPGRDKDAVIRKKKLSYYKRHINADYSPLIEEYVEVDQDGETEKQESEGETELEHEQQEQLREREKKAKTVSSDPSPPPSSSSPSSSSTSTSFSTSSSTSSATTSSSSASSSSSSSAASSSPSSKPSSTAPASSKKLKLFFAYTELASHLLGLLLVLPILLGLTSALRGFQLALVHSIFHIARSYGRPRMTREYGALLVRDDMSHFILYALVCFADPGNFVALVPVLTRSLLFVSRAGLMILPKKLPAHLVAKIEPPLSKFVGFGRDIWLFNALSEVMYGSVLLLQLLFPGRRNFFGCVLMWQYLRVRYMVSPTSQLAFGFVKEHIDQYLHHERCPGVVGRSWDKFCGFLRGLASMPEPGAAGNMLANKCVVM
eukprot:g48065.t1